MAEDDARPTTTASETVLPLGAALGPGEDVASVLDHASGTVVRRLGGLGDFAALSLRGSTFRQVEVFLDGIPLNPDGADVVNLSELPAAAFDHVELYRGSAPARYGSAAMGGVVDLVTPQGGEPTALSVAGGSFGTLRSNATLGRSVGPVEVLAAAEQFHTEGDWAYFDDAGTEYNVFDDRTETRENNAIDRLAGLARARVRAGRHTFSLLDAPLLSHQELAGPISSPSPTASLATARNLLVGEADLHPAPEWRVDTRLWWLWREERYDDRGGEMAGYAVWQEDRWGTVGGQADVSWAARPWLGSSVTVRARDERFSATNLLAEDDYAPRSRAVVSGALSATLSLWRDRLRVDPVVQVEWFGPRDGSDPTTTLDDAADAEVPASTWPLPRLGVALAPWPFLALRANGGRSARAPDFLELYGDRGMFAGNPALRPETGWGFDVGLRAQTPDLPVVHASLDLAYARNYAEDLIVWVQNSQYTTRAENVDRAYVRTTEAALDVTLFDVVDSRSNVTWMLTRNLSDDPQYANNELPRLPAWEVNQVTRVHWRDVVSLSHTYSWVSGTFTDTPNYNTTAPREIHSAALRVKPHPALPSVGVEVLNVFDVRGLAVDRNPLSDEDDARIIQPLADFSGYPLPGRTILVQLGWTPTPRGTP